jgi:atypical dual specificity phosphatase
VVRELLTRLPYGLEGEIYRSPLPHSPLFDPDGALLDAFVSAGVDVVVMLTSKEEVWEVTGQDLTQVYHTLGFDVIYAPVEDFSIPEPGAFQAPICQALQAARSGKIVVAHCHAGLGRTGLFAACLAKVVLDLNGEAAVQWVRQYVPEAIQTAAQFRFVENFVYHPEVS